MKLNVKMGPRRAAERKKYFVERVALFLKMFSHCAISYFIRKKNEGKKRSRNSSLISSLKFIQAFCVFAASVCHLRQQKYVADI